MSTVCDDIKRINGQAGEYITVAKNSDNDWFFGAMTNSKAREYLIKLDILGLGNYEAHIFQDARDSSVDAEKIEILKKRVKNNDTLNIKMVFAGEYVAHIQKVK